MRYAIGILLLLGLALLACPPFGQLCLDDTGCPTGTCDPGTHQCVDDPCITTVGERFHICGNFGCACSGGETCESLANTSIQVCRAAGIDAGCADCACKSLASSCGGNDECCSKTCAGGLCACLASCLGPTDCSAGMVCSADKCCE